MLFAREGAQIVVADLSADGVRQAAELITEAGGEAMAVVADISKSADVSVIMTATLETYGRLDCAFTCGGPGSTPAIRRIAGERVTAMGGFRTFAKGTCLHRRPTSRLRIAHGLRSGAPEAAGGTMEGHWLTTRGQDPSLNVVPRG